MSRNILLRITLRFCYKITMKYFTMQCTMSIACLTLYRVQYKIYNVAVSGTVYTVQCILYTVHCTLYSVHCTVYSVHDESTYYIHMIITIRRGLWYTFCLVCKIHGNHIWINSVINICVRSSRDGDGEFSTYVTIFQLVIGCK